MYRGMKFFEENYVFALDFGEEINKSNDVAGWLILNEVYLKFILINFLQLKEAKLRIILINWINVIDLCMQLV